VRALLIVNPQATSTTELRRDVIVSALASEIDLEVVQTRYRGHAAALAAGAVNQGLDLVLTLGGDGTVNETVNGLLRAAGPRQPDELPVLAPIPGGNANVFLRSLGLPMDPIDATGRILAAIAADKTRSIGVGRAGDTYFIFSAGIGIDAEVVRAMEGLRASGRKASDALYVWTTIRQYFAVTDRRHPALTLEREGQPPVDHLYLGIVSNCSPWTYLGRRPVNPNPLADFDSGLDLFALRRLRTVSTLRALGQMLSSTNKVLHGADVYSLHDESEFVLRSTRPIALQVDGEYMGEHEQVAFRSIPHALRVIS
jgi:diacylglycerol kinase family enzyme